MSAARISILNSRFPILYFFSFLLVCCSGSACADETKRPRVFLVLCEGLTLNDVHLSDNSNPHLAFLARNGTIGLMNCATAAPKSDTAAALALAVGRLIPAEKTDELAANDWEKVPNETVGAEESYRRRMGYPALKTPTYDPDHTVKHLGMQSLQQRGLDSARLGAVLAAAKPPVKCWVVGNTDTERWKRRAALLTVDLTGRGAGLVALRSYDAGRPYGLTDSPPTLAEYALKSDADFVVIQMGDGARAENARGKLTDAEYTDAHEHAIRLLDKLVFVLTEKLNAGPRRTDLLLVAPRPPSADTYHKDNWNHLTPLIAYGPDFPPGLFTSATTRTPGVIANIDVAPTLLKLYQLPVPITMTGRPMRILREPVAAQNDDAGDNNATTKRLAQIARLDSIATLNDMALAPTLTVLGLVCVPCCLGGMLAVRQKNWKRAGIFAWGLIFTLNFPAALLLTPLLIPPTLIEYIVRIGLWMLGLTAVCWGCSRLVPLSLPVIACALNIVMIIADTLAGQPLLKDALISNYYVPGFRYYGVGNDFLGVVLGYGLAGGFTLIDDLVRARLPAFDPEDPTSEVRHPAAAALVPLVWAGIAVVLGWPTWGANAGSLIATGAGFGLGAWLLWDRKRHWLADSLAGIIFSLFGIACSFGFAVLDSRFNGSESAHAGMALRAAGAGRGSGYLLEIIQRKLLFNLSLLASPWTWLTVCLLAGVVIVASVLVEAQLDELKLRRPWLSLSVTAVFAAALASLFFKDSGVTVVCYLVSTVMLIRFYYLLTPAS